MKKVIAMLLATVMVLSLAACGTQSAPAATEAVAQAATEAAIEKVTEASTEVATEAPEEETPVTEVDYYCSIGAYLDTLQEEVDKWNASVGKEKDIYINVISNINSYSTDLTAMMQAGTHFDIINGGSAEWFLNGWLQDLYEIENPEIKALVSSYSDLLVNGQNIFDGHCISIPNTATSVKLAVNTDLFEKNGLELPKTWDDVVHAAQVITENGGGREFGFGWCKDFISFRRLCMKLSMSSVGTGWFDPNTATYDFGAFKEPIQAIITMYQNGWMMGADDLEIDPIRAQFAEGVVGMFPAPSYDYKVYTAQFPAKCNWTVIDGPTISEGEPPYKGIFYVANGTSIDKVSYEDANDVKKKAIEEAWLFLNSDDLNRLLYSIGAIIPAKASISEGAEVSPDLGPQWAQFADLTKYAVMSQFPDSVLPLEGDNYETTLTEAMHGAISLDDAIADLNERYNAAYQELKEDGDVDISVYEYTYDISRK